MSNALTASSVSRQLQKYLTAELHIQ